MTSRRTRRDFLQAAGGALGAAGARGAGCGPPGIPANHLPPIPTGKPKPLPLEPQVLPRPLLSSTEGQDRLSQLMHAYDILLCRPANDPTSLFHQMWWHDLYCGHTASNVHATWAFLPWHRAFLYFHERILRSILGDSFRLPVWDWDKDEHVPAAYTTWAFAKLRPHSKSDLGGMVNRCSMQAWLFGSDYSAFAGYPANYMSGNVAPAGTAPQGSHSFVHTYIGGAFSPTTTAAADPLFYAHHANIDRFWIHWRKAHPDFSPMAHFDSQPFCFYDEFGKQRFVTSGDFMNERRLGYCYEQAPVVPVPEAGSELVSRQFIPDAVQAETLFQRLPQMLEDYLRNPLAALNDGRRLFNGGVRLLQESDIMAPFSIRSNALNVQPGNYYLIALDAGVCGDYKNTRVVAGFGVFGPSGGHSHGTIIATGCLTRDDFAFISQHKKVRMVYGQAGGDMVVPETCTAIWPAEITILRP